jgi:hypothetical protein
MHNRFESIGLPVVFISQSVPLSRFQNPANLTSFHLAFLIVIPHIFHITLRTYQADFQTSHFPGSFGDIGYYGLPHESNLADQPSITRAAMAH